MYLGATAVPLISFLVFLDAWGGLIAFFLQFNIKLPFR